MGRRPRVVSRISTIPVRREPRIPPSTSSGTHPMKSTFGRKSAPMQPKKWQVGDIVEIKLPDGSYAYGKIFREGGVVFFKARFSKRVRPGELANTPYPFSAMVTWERNGPPQWLRIVGNLPSRHDDPTDLWTLARYPDGRYVTINQDLKQEPASAEEIETLYPAMAFGELETSERLMDELDGRRIAAKRRYARLFRSKIDITIRLTFRLRHRSAWPGVRDWHTSWLWYVADFDSIFIGRH